MPIFRLEGDDISNAELVIAQETNLELESHLEDWLENSPRQTLAQEDFLWIGRQTSVTDEENTMYSDLLGVDFQGNLVIVELKKGRTPREVVAQLLDYAAWAEQLSESEIREIAENYFRTRGEFEGKTFDEVFRAVFDMPETDEFPPLNRTLRLFIVAEEIPERVTRVCRFLRASHGIDVTCIVVSIFQTELGEIVVSTETIVGDEQFAGPNKSRRKSSSSPRPPSDEPVEQIVWKAVQEFTDGDLNVTFSPIDIERTVENKHPDFLLSRVRRLIRGSCVNFSKRRKYPIGEDRYWWVSRGKYRLYDPEKDKIKENDDVNQAESVAENPT
ncbi:MAG: hypothetical protein OXM61_12645 [Candidatus Poribacteria bacterium]|nr:hypothetical protein [Candidatus Poribacteria bacterium]